jgi:hypothetical protein
MGKKKVVISRQKPGTDTIKSYINADAYYSEYPSWCFNSCDRMCWKIGEHELWEEILPKLQN